MEVCKWPHKIWSSVCPCRRTSMMLLLLALLSTIWTRIVMVEATGDRGREEQLWKATQTLRVQLEELNVANAKLKQEIIQIEEDGERLDRETNLLIAQEGPLKDELAIVKNAVINALATVETIPLIRRLLNIRLRWMGEVEKEEFAQAYKAVLDIKSPSHRYNIHMSHTENMLRIYNALCVKLVRSQLWDPYRVDPEKEELVLRMVDPIRERLREAWGETICDLVLIAKRELLDHNPSGAYSVPMPWDPTTRHVVKHSEVIKHFGLTILECNRLMENCQCSDSPPHSPTHSPPRSPTHSPYQYPHPQMPFCVSGTTGGVAWDDDPPGERGYWDSNFDLEGEVVGDEDPGDREGFEQPDILGFENFPGQGPLAPPNSPAVEDGPSQGSTNDDSGWGVEPTRSDPPQDEYDPPEETEEYLFNLIG